MPKLLRAAACLCLIVCGGCSASVQPLPSCASCRGSAAPILHIVEFADFECRSCSKSAEELDEFLSRHRADVRHDFRHLPLPLHNNARLAARAAAAAGLQNKFWEMHDVLFLNQAWLDGRLIRRLAADIGLDTARFAADLDSRAVDEILAADLEAARRLGILSVPFYVINGKPRGGRRILKDLEAGLEAAKKSGN